MLTLQKASVIFDQGINSLTLCSVLLKQAHPSYQWMAKACLHACIWELYTLKSIYRFPLDRKIKRGNQQNGEKS